MSRIIDLDLIAGKVIYDLGTMRQDLGEEDVCMKDFNSLSGLVELLNAKKLEEIKLEYNTSSVVIDAVCLNSRTFSRDTNVEFLLMSDGNCGQVIQD